MAEHDSKFARWMQVNGFAVTYLLLRGFVQFLDWLDGKPRVSMQDEIIGSTVFVLWGIGTLVTAIESLSKRIGPPGE
jgi:hypothetical protein